MSERTLPSDENTPDRSQWIWCKGKGNCGCVAPSCCYEPNLQPNFEAGRVNAPSGTTSKVGVQQPRKPAESPALLTSKNCSECSALRDALEFLYAKWENGDPCTDGGEPDGASMGNAFRLNEREEKWILSLIPKFPTNPQPPALETCELQQLRRIDKAARAFVDARPGKNASKAYAALIDALFDGRPTLKAVEQPSPVDDAEFGTAEWRAANPESDGGPRG